MEYDEFKSRLKDIGLTVKDFAKLSGVGYGTCSSWARPNRKVSAWVDSWLNLYIENKEFQTYKELVQTLVGNVKAS